MAIYYAQVNESDVVIGISQLSEEVDLPHLIRVDSLDDSLIRKKYNRTTLSFEDVPKSLEEIKVEKKVELLQAYYASFTTFQSSATGTIKTYPCDQEAQQNLKDYEQRLIANPNKDSFWFKTIEDGTLVNHTRAQFLQLMEDAETFKVNLTIKYNDKIKQVDLATTETEVNAIVW